MTYAFFPCQIKMQLFTIHALLLYLHFNQIKLSGLDRLILLTVIADIIPPGDALIDLDKWKRMSWYC